ncbi:MAG: NFACT RNA binding domain-containing protein [Cyanobacteria bacterium P01_A01_bin.17]
MQPVDFTTLYAACCDLRSHWLPARLEQIYQRDRYTLYLALRTLDQRGWLTISWHPQAARLCLGTPPPKAADTFTFSEQLRHQLKGLALVALESSGPWERVIDLQFARRPQDPVSWHLYVEVMNKYSNVILTTDERKIVTVAHQVSEKQSRVRPLQTGQPYSLPPALTDPAPSLEESQAHWQERVALVPGPVARNLRTYRGLSPALARSMAATAGLPTDQNTAQLTSAQWKQLFILWQDWLQALEQETFTPGWQSEGYTVMGWQMTQPAPDIHQVLDQYYTQQLNQQVFKQLRHQLQQKVSSVAKKLQVKANSFHTQLQAAETADEHRQQADLLMANLQAWEVGMQSITLPDFEGDTTRTISLNPEQNAVQNAQALYKRHQKLKRSRDRLEPLLAEVELELQYLHQVEVAIEQTEAYENEADLETLEEIRIELIEQGYWPTPDHVAKPQAKTDFIRHQSPDGWELLVGRNNRQNDQLTFSVATSYDLWFHTQEIPGSHALLRLDAGAAASETDIEWAAHFVAYYSRARQSHQVPVVYTSPKHVYKPKGAQPGMVIYKHEQVTWGQPQLAKAQMQQPKDS